MPIGRQGKAFDRVGLDVWADDYVQRSGRPGRLKGDSIWDKKERQASSNVKVSGTLTRKSGGKRLRESCGTGSLREAETFLARRIEQLRQAELYGVRPTRTFDQAAAKFVRENSH